MAQEPVSRHPHPLLQRSWFFEQMGGSRNNREFLFAGQKLKCLAIQLNHDVIFAAHNEERGSPDIEQRATREVGASAPGDHGVDRRIGGGGYECSSSAGAGTEIADREPTSSVLLANPLRRRKETLREQIDV